MPNYDIKCKGCGEDISIEIQLLTDGYCPECKSKIRDFATLARLSLSMGDMINLQVAKVTYFRAAQSFPFDDAQLVRLHWEEFEKGLEPGDVVRSFTAIQNSPVFVYASQGFVACRREVPVLGVITEFTVDDGKMVLWKEDNSTELRTMRCHWAHSYMKELVKYSLSTEQSSLWDKVPSAHRQSTFPQIEVLSEYPGASGNRKTPRQSPAPAGANPAKRQSEPAERRKRVAYEHPMLRIFEAINGLSEARRSEEEKYIEVAPAGTLCWGWPGVDTFIGRLKPPARVILAGETGSGKTSLLISLLVEILKNKEIQKWPTAWINLNLSGPELSRRIACGLFGLPLKGKPLSSHELDYVSLMVQSMADYPLILLEADGLSASQILEMGRQCAAEKAIKVLVIDDYPIPHPLDKKRQEILREFHQVTEYLARQYELCVIISCLLPPGFEKSNASSIRRYLGIQFPHPSRSLVIRMQSPEQFALQELEGFPRFENHVPLILDRKVLTFREP